MVLLEARIHRLEEGANERNLEGRANNGAFLDDVFDWKGLSVTIKLWLDEPTNPDRI